MDTRFLVVRHPQTEANVDGRFVGRGDTPYTELGVIQRSLLSAEIAGWMPDRILSSPIRRACEVAVEAAVRMGTTAALDPRLTELDFGVAEGLTHAELQGRGISFDFKSEYAPVAPGGESREDIYRRSASIAAEQLALGGRVAIVTHGGVFRSMLIDLLGLPLSAIWSFDIQPAQMAEVVHFGDRGMLQSFRRPAGEPPQRR